MDVLYAQLATRVDADSVRNKEKYVVGPKAEAEKVEEVRPCRCG
jgi:hypothetical protein